VGQERAAQPRWRKRYTTLLLYSYLSLQLDYTAASSGRAVAKGRRRKGTPRSAERRTPLPSRRQCATRLAETEAATPPRSDSGDRGPRGWSPKRDQPRLNPLEASSIHARFANPRGRGPSLVKDFVVVTRRRERSTTSPACHAKNPSINYQWPFPRRDHAVVIDHLLAAAPADRVRRPVHGADRPRRYNALVGAVDRAHNMVLATDAVDNGQTGRSSWQCDAAADRRARGRFDGDHRLRGSAAGHAALLPGDRHLRCRDRR